MRVKRINREALDTIARQAEGVDLEALGQVFLPVYELMINEIIALCIEVIRIEKSIEGLEETHE